MTRLPTLCQLNYDRDLPLPTRVRGPSSGAQQRPRKIPSITGNGSVDFHQHILSSEKRAQTTPYRYSSSSFPPPNEANHAQNVQLRSNILGPVCNHQLTTADTSYSLPALRSRGGVETSLMINAELLDHPTWNRCLNAWVSPKSRCSHAYFNIAGQLNLNNRGVFHFVREFDELRRSPCQRYEKHMHHGTLPRHMNRKAKKIVEKPEFWHWRSRTEPVIPTYTKPKVPSKDSSSYSPCLCAYSTRARICLTLPVPTPPSPDNSCAESSRSDVPVYSPHSFFSEISSLSPFSSTSFNPVSPTETQASGNSLTTATSGIVSCDSFPSTLVPKTTPTGLSYLPAAPRFPSVVPWDGEDGWGSDISSFHNETSIIPSTADSRIHYCNIMEEQPIVLEQLTIFSWGWHTQPESSIKYTGWTSEQADSGLKHRSSLSNAQNQLLSNNGQSQFVSNSGQKQFQLFSDNGQSPLVSSNGQQNDNKMWQSVSKNLWSTQSVSNHFEHQSENSGALMLTIVEQKLVPPLPLVSSDIVKVEGLDRVTIREAPLLQTLPELPTLPSSRVATAEVHQQPNELPKMRTPSPKTMHPAKRKQIIKKQRPVVHKVVRKRDTGKPSTPSPIQLPKTDVLSNVTQEDNVRHEPTPVSKPDLKLPPLPKLSQFDTKPKPPSPILLKSPSIPTSTPPLTPNRSVPSPSPTPPKQHELGMPNIDMSFGIELERQRRADERRRKALLMYENLKKRKGGTQVVSQMSIQLMDSGWLSQFCIIKREKEYLYRRAFEAADEDKDGFLTCQEMLIALKGVASVNSLSDAEEEYVYRVLELAGYSVLSGADFKLFSVVAALTQKIASVDDWMKNFILRMDFKMLDMKVFRAKELFLWNVDETTNELSLERLMIELKAGGVSQEHQDEVQTKLKHLGSLDVLDFLTYLPLFLLMHSSVITNPFDTTRDK